MFARTAKVLILERQHAVRAEVRRTFSTQEPDRLNAPLRRRRPVLVRRWQLDPVSGKPICAWEVQSPDLPPKQQSRRLSNSARTLWHLRWFNPWSDCIRGES